MLTTELVPAPDKNSRRLLIVLHGLGDSMEGYRWMPEMLRLPWLNYLLVNAPDDYYGGYSWFDFEGNPAPGILRSREMLMALLDSLPARGFPSGQTMLFGFSQGCVMTLDVGLRHRERLAGLIGISGDVAAPEVLVREFSPFAREVPALMTHGPADPVIPIARARRNAQVLIDAGARLQWREFPKAHTIAGEEELLVIAEFILACLFPKAGS